VNEGFRASSERPTGGADGGRVLPGFPGIVDADPVGPLWRGAQLFRAVSYCYALGFHIAVNDDLTHSGVAWALFGVLTVVTAACGVGYYRGFARTRYWVAGEITVVVALMLSTMLVADDHWALGNQTWPTTLWATNAMISAALLWGPWSGIETGLVIGASSTIVKGTFDPNLGRNATIIVIVAAGLAVGIAGSTARRLHETLSAAERRAAAAEERERLARQVHDGVLQTLAYIAKHGREIGGPSTRLAELAGEQERALRMMIADIGEADTQIVAVADDAAGDTDTVDLTVVLRGLAADDVSVSAPGTPVPVGREVAGELRAALTNAIANTRTHAGPGARSYVLLEDLDDEVVVSVRDDGVGIEPGRLEQARRDGRMGVSKSIVGRIEALGGRVLLVSSPGAGTEWEWTVDRGMS
jgi:signal transduction histidine kinase